MEVQGTNLNATEGQTESYEVANNQLFKVVNSTINEENICDVKIKNVSGRHIDRAELKIDEAYYFVYDIENKEEVIISTFSEKKIEELKVVSVEFDTKFLYDGEIILDNVEVKDGVIKGKIKNSSERDLYPSEIIYFVKDENGNNVQKYISYAACFNDELVIKPGKTFEFEQEENNSLSTDKSIIVRYSDTEFREINTIMFN